VRIARDPVGALTVGCSRNGSRVLAVNEEAVRVYTRTGRMLASVDGHTLEFVEDAAISPDGTRIAVAGAEEARVVAIPRGRRVASFDVQLATITFDTTGSRIAGGTERGVVRIWDLVAGGRPTSLRGHALLVADVVFSPDGTLVVSAGTDGRARVWDAISGEEIAVLRGHSLAVRDAGFGPGGRTIVTASDDGTARVWETPVLAVLAGDGTSVTRVATTPDGSRVATLSRDGQIRLWDARAGSELARIRVPRTLDLAISADGRRLLTVQADEGRARVYEFARPSRPIFLPVPSATGAAFSRDASMIAVTGSGRTIHIFDPKGRPLRRFRAPPDLEEIGPIAFSAEGDRLVVAEIPEGAVVILDAVTGNVVARLSEPALRALAVAFASGGGEVATAEADGVARVWNAGTGSAIPPVLAGHEGAVTTVSFSPDSTLVATAGLDRTVRIWHVATGFETLRIRGTSAAFAGTGRTLVTGGPGRTAHVYECGQCGSVSELRERARERRR
jgi:WD40 repeat protein